VSVDAFYLPVGPDTYEPTEAAQGPWDTGYQHGGPPTALLAAAIGAHADGPGMRVARITAEFLRPIPMTPLTVSVEVLRHGRKIALLGAELSHDGTPYVLARAWLHAVAEDPGQPATKSEPPPPLPAPAEDSTAWDWFGYGRALEWRPTAGDPGRGFGPAAVWARMRVPLVAGRTPTGLDGVLVLADSTNGVSLEMPVTEWLSTPTSVTVTVLRVPAGGWVHLDARTRLAGDGVGLAHGLLSDADGVVAMATQPLHVAPLTRTGPPARVPD
jgi:hypothetical protein